MVDKLTPECRSENMRRIRSKDTKPELKVRRLLHSLGFRYRLHRKDLPGKPDLVFGSRRRAIFVHGCFFHQHKSCADGKLPKSRLEYWRPKLAGNVARDRTNRLRLRRDGWKSLVVWDCETSNLPKLEKRLLRFLES